MHFYSYASQIPKALFKKTEQTLKAFYKSQERKERLSGPSFVPALQRLTAGEEALACRVRDSRATAVHRKLWSQKTNKQNVSPLR